MWWGKNDHQRLEKKHRPERFVRRLTSSCTNYLPKRYGRSGDKCFSENRSFNKGILNKCCDMQHYHAALRCTGIIAPMDLVDSVLSKPCEKCMLPGSILEQRFINMKRQILGDFPGSITTASFSKGHVVTGWKVWGPLWNSLQTQSAGAPSYLQSRTTRTRTWVHTRKRATRPSKPTTSTTSSKPKVSVIQWSQTWSCIQVCCVAVHPIKECGTYTNPNHSLALTIDRAFVHVHKKHYPCKMCETSVLCIRKPLKTYVYWTTLLYIFFGIQIWHAHPCA